jgi:hypothetical protein
MNCAICGKDNQAGTRFCVHCGAALTVPPAGTPQQSTIAAAGAILGPKPPPASSAAPSASAPSTATVPVYTPRPAYLPPTADVASVPPDVQSVPAVPAYNADPKKAGLIVVVIGVVGLLAVGGYLGWQFLGGPTENKGALTRIEAPPPTQPSSPRASTESSATPPSIATETSKGPDAKSAAPTADEAKSSVAPAEEPKSTSAAPPKSDSKGASKATSSRPAAAPVITAPSAPAAPPQIAAHPVAPASGMATAPSPVVDRWAQFAEELHRCQAEAFLSRVVCDQRVRIRYCDGYWGKVAQCPGAIANPDRGQ